MSKKIEAQEPLGLSPAPPPGEMSKQELKARILLEQYDWEPVDPWPGDPKLPWRRRCLACGFVSNRRPSTLEVKKCPHPTSQQEKEALALLAEKGWVPVEPWPGSPTEKWRMRCAVCGDEKLRFGVRKSITACTRPHDGTSTPPAFQGPTPRAEWLLPAPVAEEDRPARLDAAHVRLAIEGRIGAEWSSCLLIRNERSTWVTVDYDAPRFDLKSAADRERAHEVLTYVADALAYPPEKRHPVFHVETTTLRDMPELVYKLHVRRFTPREIAEGLPRAEASE